MKGFSLEPKCIENFNIFLASLKLDNYEEKPKTIQFDFKTALVIPEDRLV